MASLVAATESRTMTRRRVRASARRARPLAVVAVALALVACTSQSGPTGNPETGAAPSATPQATATSTASAKPTASPRTPAPAALQGRWRTVINDQDKPVLTLTDFKYTIERGLTGTGSISVAGDHISFFGSNLCSGTGQYTWSVENGTLRFDSLAPDPCPERSDVIWHRPFTPME
jgi:hypothetical protein